MQQVMANAAAGAGDQAGPSFDAALGDAIEDASKDVVESIKKATPVKKYTSARPIIEPERDAAVRRRS
jgi:hypothetical protein